MGFESLDFTAAECDPDPTGPDMFGQWFDSANYNTDCSPKKCKECGGMGFDETIKDKVDNIICEIEVSCVFCHTVVGYWGYGSYDPCFANLHPTEGP